MARLHPLMYRFLEQRSASCQLEVRLRCSWAHRILFRLDPKSSSRKVFRGNFETDHLQLPCLSISIVHGDPANTKLCEDLQRLQPTLYRSLTCLRRWLVGLACGAIWGDLSLLLPVHGLTCWRLLRPPRCRAAWRRVVAAGPGFACQEPLPHMVRAPPGCRRGRGAVRSYGRGGGGGPGGLHPRAAW